MNCVVSEEGRNQYVITLTNTKTGDALSKPALYIDGNIHAGEVTSTMCAMHTVDYLLTNYGTDPEVTKNFWTQKLSMLFQEFLQMEVRNT